MRRRALGVGVVLLGGLLALAAAGLVFLSGTAAGTRWLLARAGSAGVTVCDVQGTLLGGLELHGVRWQREGTRLAIAQLRWEARPRRLAAGVLDLGDIHASGITLSLAAAPQDAGSAPTWPALRTPLPVRVRRLVLEDVTLVRDGTTQLAGAAADVSATLRGSRLDAHIHALRARDFALAGALRAGFDARAGVRARLAWRRAGTPVWAGDLGLEGALSEALTARHTLTAPAAATLDARIETPLDPGAWQLVLRLPETALQRLGELPAWTAQAHIEARGAGLAGTARGNFRLAGTPAGALTGDLALAADRGGLRLEALSVSAPDGAQATLAGTVGLGQAARSELHLRWTALRWPLSGAPAVAAPRGALALEGTPQTWRFALDADLDTAAVGTVALRAGGQGTREALAAHTFAAELLGGAVRGSAHIAWADGLAWGYALRARGLDPAARFPGWKGAVGGALAGSGHRGAAGVIQELRLAALSGALRGQALGGQGRVRQAAGAWHAEALALRAGRARVRLDGTWGGTLSAVLDVPALGELVPDAGGALHAEITARGTLPDATVRASARARTLRWQDWRLARLETRFDFAPSADRLTLDLAAHGAAGPVTLDTLRLTAGPRRSAHTIVLDAHAPGWRATAQARGGLDAPSRAWSGALSTLSIAPARGAPWVLDAPAPLALSRTDQRLGRACLVSSGARACVAGKRDGAGYTAHAALEDFALGLLAPVLPPGLTLDGHASGTADLAGGTGRPALTAELRATPGRITYHAPDGQPVTLPHGGAALAARGGAQQTAVSAVVYAATPGASLLDAALTLPPWPLPAPAQAPLRGTLAVHGLDLGPLAAAFLPELAPQGVALDAAFALEGTLAQPAPRGQARLRAARVGVGQLGIEVQDLDVRATAQGAAPLRIAARAQSDDGSLEVAGTLTPDAARGYPLALEVSGTRFLIADTAQARVRVSPDLTVTGAARRLRVRGEVVVPEARIEPADTAQAAGVSPDVVVLGAPPQAASPWQVDSEVTVRLGEAVRVVYRSLGTGVGEFARVNAFSMNARLGGALTVRDRPDELTRAWGEITLAEGELSIYGQRLPITRGQLVYAGQPVDDPALRFEAARTVGDVTAGVRVRGRARAPTLSVYSSPSLPQEEALAYVVLGRPLRGASQAQADLLMRAAGSLGLRGGAALAQRLGARLGLDDVGLSSGDGDTDALQGAVLKVGKYLSPRLYVGYGTGLFGESGAVRVRFDLTRQWVVEATSGVAQAVDLLYTLER